MFWNFMDLVTAQIPKTPDGSEAFQFWYWFHPVLIWYLNQELKVFNAFRIYNGIRIPQGGENLLQLGTQNLRELKRVGLMGLATNWYRFVVQRILKWLS